MLRLQKHVRMAQLRRLNFWHAKWRLDTVEADEPLQPGPGSYQPNAMREYRDLEARRRFSADDE